jgi:hypothetical protein
MKKALTFVVFSLVILVARDTTAQPLPWTDRGYFNLNIGFESGSDDYTDEARPLVYDEQAVFRTAQSVDSGAFFDFSAGARVWRNLSVGIGFHEGSTDGDATVEGTIPHPIITDRPRAFTSTATGLERSERAIHLQFGYMIIVSERVTAHAMLGPSFFKLRQDVISDVAFTENPGFTSVTVTPTITERVDSPVGFNIGVDVAYQFLDTNTIKLGAGLLLRYAAATADLPLMANTVDSDVGGFHVGLGARLRF